MQVQPSSRVRGMLNVLQCVRFCVGLEKVSMKLQICCFWRKHRMVRIALALVHLPIALRTARLHLLKLWNRHKEKSYLLHWNKSSQLCLIRQCILFKGVQLSMKFCSRTRWLTHRDDGCTLYWNWRPLSWKRNWSNSWPMVGLWRHPHRTVHLCCLQGKNMVKD